MRAHPGTKAYGALSVAVQYYCEAEQVVNVPASCFVPQPKVDSAVLRLDMRTEPPVVLEDQDMFFRCVKAGFDQRDRRGISRGGGDRSGKKSRDSGPCGICKTCKRSRKEIS